VGVRGLLAVEAPSPQSVLSLPPETTDRRASEHQPFADLAVPI